MVPTVSFLAVSSELDTAQAPIDPTQFLVRDLAEPELVRPPREACFEPSFGSMEKAEDNTQPDLHQRRKPSNEARQPD